MIILRIIHRSKRLLLTLTISLAFGFYSNAQVEQKIAPNSKQYIKVQATGNVFMCPVLTPRFTNQVKNKYQAQDIVVSDDKNGFYFTTTHQLTKDSVEIAAKNCAIPLNVITEIIISDRPIPITKKVE